jgi:hypothetical protein
MTNDTMTQTDTTTGTWVAVGPAGAVGLYGRRGPGGTYPSLHSAKGAVHNAMGPLAERPEFRAH